MKKSSLALALLALILSTSTHAGALKNSDFLKLSEGQQHWWYAGVYTALGHIVSLDNDETKAQCVWDWFFTDPDQRKNQLAENFELFPDHAPTSIAIGLLRRDCNVFAEK